MNENFFKKLKNSILGKKRTEPATQAELEKEFKFSYEDITLNKNGIISDHQKEVIKKRTFLEMIFLATLLLPMLFWFFAVSTGRYTPSGGTIGIFNGESLVIYFILELSGFLLIKTSINRRKALNESIEVVEGKPSFYSNGYRHTTYYMLVNNVDLIVSYKTNKLFNGSEKVRVYYLKRISHCISIELLS
ncbi:MAG: hypothetical protein Fur003_5850 [Candidatus Dojkabacteria bacterium]